MTRRDPDMDRMLELYRAATGPAPGAKDRVWESVEAATVPTPDAGSGGAPAAASGTMVSGKAVLVGGALVLAGTLLLWTTAEPTTPGRPIGAQAPVVRAVVSGVEAGSGTGAGTTGAGTGAGTGAEIGTETGVGIGIANADEAGGVTDSVSADATGAGSGRVGEAAALRSTLAAEMKLMTAAQRAMRDGDPANALGLLRRHRARFPEGVMAEEREAERVQALCDLGRMAPGRMAAERFLGRFPGSPLAAKVRRACAEPPR